MFNWNIFDLFYFIMFAMVFVIRWPYAKVYKTMKITKTHFDVVEKAGLFLAFMGGGILPLIYLFTPVFKFADYHVSAVSGITGIVFAIPAMWLFWRSHRDLGIQWSPKLEFGEQHRLITQGIYSYIRHPMYSSIFLTGVTQILLIGNWLVGPSYLVGFGILYILRVKQEESFISEQFGDEYISYIKRTDRVLPIKYLRNIFK
jgi:protein-S-isoprenylcysteine O-methyltransferase Ste14